MSGKLNTTHSLTYLLVLVLLISMFTATSYAGAGMWSASVGGDNGSANSPLIHMSLDFYGDSETFEDVYQVLVMRLGFRSNQFSRILAGAAVMTVTVCRQNNNIIISPTFSGETTNLETITLFMHAEDGMK